MISEFAKKNPFTLTEDHVDYAPIILSGTHAEVQQMLADRGDEFVTELAAQVEKAKEGRLFA